MRCVFSSSRNALGILPQPHVIMGTDALLEALRTENRILEAQNELLKLFIGLPPSRGEIANSQSDLPDSVPGSRLQQHKAKKKRRRAARKPTVPTPVGYEMDVNAAFEKYGFSLPETARDALLLMMCVPERDLRRAARLRLMTLLFPSRMEKSHALRILRAFLEEQGAACYIDIMQMALFKHLNGSI